MRVLKNNFFNLKTVAITQVVSRSGTIYLHSLLDNHPEIATIPATININCLLNQNSLSPLEYYNLFKKNNPKFFDTSKFTLKDDRNSMLFMLGKNQSSGIKTDQKLFKEIFLKALQNQNINPRSVILSLYYAYNYCHKKDFSKFKLILLHPHEKKTTIKFNKFFKKTLYLVCLRDPIRAYESIIKKNKIISKLRNQIYYPSGQLLQSALDIYEFNREKMRMHFIKIEDLGFNTIKSMKKLADFLNIKFSKTTMSKSTFGGLEYWGNTPNKAFNHFDKRRHLIKSKLNKKDQMIIYLLNKEFMKALKYTNLKLSTLEKFFYPIILILPLNDEWKFIKKNFLKPNFLLLKFIIYFFPKRILLLFISFLNKFSKRYDVLKKI